MLVSAAVSPEILPSFLSVCFQNFADSSSEISPIKFSEIHAVINGYRIYFLEFFKEFLINSFIITCCGFNSSVPLGFRRFLKKNITFLQCSLMISPRIFFCFRRNSGMFYPIQKLHYKIFEGFLHK